MSSGNKRKFGQCRLCQDDGRLCLSHVYPKFLIKMAKGDDETLHRFSRSPEYSYTQLVQDFGKEHMLCSACEQKLGVWEKYAKEVLFDHEFPWVDYEGCYQIQVDYRLFKLFQLSILWRMAAAQAAPFQSVQLSPRVFEEIRTALLSESSIAPDYFGCILLSMPRTGIAATIPDQFITMPRVSTLGQYAMCNFILGRHIWLYMLTEVCEENLPMMLQPNGTLRVMVKESAAGVIYESEVLDAVVGDPALYQRHVQKLEKKYSRKL